MNDWRRWDSFPPSNPRLAKGGIRAQSQRGNFGQSWWAKRWLAVLETFQLGGRLQRGRSYARNGQVLSIDVEPGTVTARVQGSRATPYEIRIQVKPLSKADWTKVAEAVSRQAIFAANLLAGEMPHEIETVFTESGLSLFPEKYSGLKTGCSCPDSSNPCKHIAAVYYLLGEEFDRDPFLIFQLRGMNREQLLALLSTAAPHAASTEEAVAETVHTEPLSSTPSIFWNGGAIPEDLVGEAGSRNMGAALPRRLGKFPFWRGSENFLDTLESIYTSAAKKAEQMVSGE